MKQAKTLFVVTLLLLGFSSEAVAIVSLDDQPVIRKPVLWRQGRHEFMPTFSVSIRDPFVRNLVVGVSYMYHISNWLGTGLDFGYAIPIKTATVGDIESAVRADPARSSFDFEGSHLGFLLNLNLNIVPVYGKFTLFDAAVVNYDLHIIAGAGVAQIKSTGDRMGSSFAFAPLVGIGARLFIVKWLAINLEFRDYIISQSLYVKADTSVSDKAINQNFLVTIGISFFFPTEVRYGR